MSEAPITSRQAWQPLTPRGVAAFAAASLGRLLLVQLLVAVMAAAMTVWFVSENWLPVVREAVQALPDSAAIHDGTLLWTNRTPVRLAENRLLALSVDAKDSGKLGREAHIEIALHDTHFIVASLFGYVQLLYPRGWTITLDRAQVIPWWGAWERPLLGLLAGAVVILLLTSWWVLATLYFPLVKAFAFYANRRLGWGGSWKLAGAALLPGACVVMAGVAAYGWLGMDLFQLGLFYLLHFVTTWAYIAASPFFLPKEPAAIQAANPFVPPAAPEEADEPEPEQVSPPAPAAPADPPAKSDNPFAAPPPPAEPKRKTNPENPFASPR